MGANARPAFLGDIERQTAIGERKRQHVGAAILADDCEPVGFFQIEKRDAPLVLGVRSSRRQLRLIERDIRQAIALAIH